MSRMDNGMDPHRGYGDDEPRNKGGEDEDPIVADPGNHTPLTPQSGYGLTSVVAPIPWRAYNGDTLRSDGSGTEEQRAYSQDPWKHPRPITQGVDHGLSSPTWPQLRVPQESVRRALGGGVVEALPRKLMLRVQIIKVSFRKPNQPFSVRFMYGNKNHTTLPATAVSSDEHTWFGFRPSPPHYRHSPSDRSSPEVWLIETDKKTREQVVSVELLRRNAISWKPKVLATGAFSVSPPPVRGSQRS